jgi:hypothetical protein
MSSDSSSRLSSRALLRFALFGCVALLAPFSGSYEVEAKGGPGPLPAGSLGACPVDVGPHFAHCTSAPSCSDTGKGPVRGFQSFAPEYHCNGLRDRNLNPVTRLKAKQVRCCILDKREAEFAARDAASTHRPINNYMDTRKYGEIERKANTMYREREYSTKSKRDEMYRVREEEKRKRYEEEARQQDTLKPSDVKNEAELDDAMESSVAPSEPHHGQGHNNVEVSVDVQL